MKKFWLANILIFCCSYSFSQSLYDSFTDGNFTTNPVWGGTTSAWIISPNSDAGPGATGSNTLRLAAPATIGTEYLSSQVSNWDASQEWGFFIGRRVQGASSNNQSYFWLYANEADLNSPTVDGYRIAFGDDLAYDRIRLEYIVDGAVNSTIISQPIMANGATDFAFLVRVSRSRNGAWEMYCALGSTVVATMVPNINTANLIIGTGSDNNLVPAANGYIGVAALHTAGANAILALEFDQIHLTTYPSNTPTITLSPMVIDSFVSHQYIPSAAKSYVIEGHDLTSDIIINTPVFSYFEVSLTENPFVPNSSIHLTPVTGVVSPTTIYVRLNTDEMGLVGNDIENTSTGAVTKNVLCRGNILTYPPTVSSTISFGAVTNNSIVVNFSGGNGSYRLLLVKESSPVNAVPPNGMYYGPYNFGTGIPLGDGNYPVYRNWSGVTASTTVTGLTAGKTYYFEVFDYNADYNGHTGYGAESYLVPGNVGNNPTAYSPVMYNWVGGNGSWTTTYNWSPARISPATSDILVFSDGGTDTITNVPNLTIAQLHVSSSTKITLVAAASSSVLNIDGSVVGDDLTVEAGSELFIIGPDNSYKLNVATGNTSAIDGKLTLKGATNNFTVPEEKRIIKQ